MIEYKRLKEGDACKRYFLGIRIPIMLPLVAGSELALGTTSVSTTDELKLRHDAPPSTMSLPCDPSSYTFSRVLSEICISALISSVIAPLGEDPSWGYPTMELNGRWSGVKEATRLLQQKPCMCFAFEPLCHSTKISPKSWREGTFLARDGAQLGSLSTIARADPIEPTTPKTPPTLSVRKSIPKITNIIEARLLPAARIGSTEQQPKKVPSEETRKRKQSPHQEGVHYGTTDCTVLAGRNVSGNGDEWNIDVMNMFGSGTVTTSTQSSKKQQLHRQEE